MKDRAKRIGTYIAQLGGETDFATRLAAEEALDKLGPLAEPAIRTALTSADPEVRYRANRLMRRLKLEEGESSLAAARGRAGQLPGAGEHRRRQGAAEEDDRRGVRDGVPRPVRRGSGADEVSGLVTLSP